MAAPLSPKIQDLVARLNRDPDSKIFLQLADEYRKEGLLEEALLVCTAGIKKHPGYQSAHVALGRIYLALDRLDEARAEFETVLRNSPDNLLANRLLGDALAESGDRAGALERYRTVLMFGPADPEISSRIEALERGAVPPQGGGHAGAPAPEPAAAPPPAAPPGADPAAPDPPEGAAGAGSPPRPPSEATSPGTRGRDGIHTQTLAELYVRQGLIDRAVDMYRRMLSQDPQNLGIQRRLRELEPRLGPESVAVSAGAGPEQAPSPSTAAGRNRAESIARLERWLRSIQGGRP